MAEIRSMLRAFAWDHTSTPGEIVSRLDQALVTLDAPTMATLIFARLERTADSSWQLAWTNAGHPPPLLLDRDGHSRFLDAENDPLLGIVPFARRQNFTTTLTPSTTVVFYSDGLVESAARPIDTGLESLRDHAARLAHSSLADLCDGSSPGSVPRATTTTWRSSRSVSPTLRWSRAPRRRRSTAHPPPDPEARARFLGWACRRLRCGGRLPALSSTQ